MAKNSSIILLILILIGTVLRWVNLEQSMSFFYDQARDAIISQKILTGKLVLIGPMTDTPGIFFGPVWYYILAVFYFISSGNPVTVLQIISLFDLATVVLFYVVGKEFFNKKVGLVAAAIWAVGALPVAYARTLSNPSTTAFWVLLVIFSLIQVAKGRPRFIVLAFLLASLLFQFNAATAFFFLPFLLACSFYLKNKINDKRLIIFAFIAAVIPFIPQFIFELRHDFIMSRSILGVFQSGNIDTTFFQRFIPRWQNLEKELADYTFFTRPLLSLVAVGISFASLVRKKFSFKTILMLWFFVPLIVYLFLYPRGEAHPHYLLSWIPVVILILSYLIVRLFPVSMVLIATLLYLNIFGLQWEIILKDHLAQPADPNKIGLADQIKVLDYVYNDAAGQSFGYYSYNVTPYWADENFQYLFRWYAKPKYGYEGLRYTGETLYIIYEPEPYLGESFQKNWLKQFKGKEWEQISKTKVGLYTVEKIKKI